MSFDQPPIESVVPSYLNEFTRQVIGAAIEVHRYLGPGLLEQTYEEALVVELALRDIPYLRQLDLGVEHKGHRIAGNRLDLLVFNELVVELKTVEAIREIHRAQVLAYLKAGPFPLGLLINFNVPRLKDGIVRIAWRTSDYPQWVLPERPGPLP